MKRFLMIFASLVISLFATGCGTSSEMLRHSETMYDKQIAATQKATPTPILQIVARPGETMKFEGVASMTVWNPSSDANTNKVPEYKLPEDPLSKFANKALDKASDFALNYLGFKLGLAAKSQSTTAADKDLLRDINTSTSFENPFK